MANTVQTNDLVNGSVTLEKLGSNVIDAINTKLPLGTIIMSTRLDTPFGFLPCDGGTYTSTQFPEFYALLVGGDFGTKFKTVTLSAWTTEFNSNSGYCGYYGIDTANGIFKLPVFADAFFRNVSDTNLIGKYGQDQIVNISGSFDGNTDDGPTAKTGAFYDKQTYFYGSNGTGGAVGGVIGFDASRVPGVKTGSQVQPRNISVRAFVQVYHSSENFSVEVKMNPDYTNATYTSVIGTSPSTATTLNGVVGKKYTGADIVVESWYANDGKSWYRKYASGFIEQGGFIDVRDINGNYVWSTTPQVILLPVPFTNTYYSFNTNSRFYSGTYYDCEYATNGFVRLTTQVTMAWTMSRTWTARGF